MEHRLLIDLVKAGRVNLVHTYLGLAEGSQSAEFSHANNFWQVTGPRELSFCNFAAGFNWSAECDQLFQELVLKATQNPLFWVFCIDGDSPADLSARLESNGFMMRQHLVQMSQDSPPKVNPNPLSIDELHEFSDRLAVCKFATRTFFTRTRPAAQDRIAKSTANSQHRLFQFKENGTIAGAFMLAETDDAIGLYNLCVRQDSRNKGIGKKLVESAQAIAQSSQKLLVLQCDHVLVEWYARLGFRSFGRVRAYTFPGSPIRDIMGNEA